MVCKPNLLIKAFVVYCYLAYLVRGKPQCMVFTSCGLLLFCVLFHNAMDLAILVNLTA